jgi:hypothetical protein
MQMQMFGDSCTRSLPQVQSEVHPVRLVDLLQNPFRAPRHPQHFIRLFQR